MIKLLILSLTIFLSFTSSAEQKCDDTGCYDKCSDTAGCSAPLGCYPMTADDFEGSSWQSVVASARRDNGQTCTAGSDSQCKSANCEWRCDEWNTDENGNNTSCKKDHNECADLKVCRKGQAGETLADLTRLCENGLIASNGKCIVTSSIAFSEDGTDSTITDVTIEPQSCAMKVPAGMNSNYRFNIYMTQLLEFLFEDPQFGGDADCLGVTKGITYISKNLKTVRQAFSQGIIQGLKEQEDKFYAELQNHSDVTKKDSVDMYMQSLNVLLENQKKYKEQNTKMQTGFQIAKDDFTKISDYYFGGFDWDSDATGDTPNRTRTYTLTDGWHAGVRDGIGQNYCRGRSPKMKNSWKRRYRQSGTPVDLAYYLQLPVPPNNDSDWNQFWDNAGDEVKNNPQGMFFGPSTIIIQSLINSYKGDVFLLDPVLPRNGVDGDYFAQFGTTDWTNTFDGDVRQALDGSGSHGMESVNGMLNYYFGYLYKKFKDDPTVLGKINSSDMPKINELSAYFMNPAAASALSPGFEKVEITEEESKKKYYVAPNANNKYSIHKSLKNFIDLALAKNFQPSSIKHVVNFHKLMWDFRQRMYLIQYLYSANGGRRHPIQQRGTFFETYDKLLKYNVDYLTALNKGHDDAITCLEKLKISYQEAVKPDGTIVSSAGNYDGKPKDIKHTKGVITQFKGDCKGEKCKETNVSANLNIPTFATKPGKDSQGGNFKGGNLQNSNLSAMEQGLKAIADARKKKTAEFLKTAGPAAKKAFEGNKHFIKMALSIPAVVASANSTDSAGGSSAAHSNDLLNSDKSKPVGSAALTIVKPPVRLPPASNNGKPLNFGEVNQSGTPAITSEEAEVMLEASKKDQYLDNDADSIFTKISKGYMRAGLPRLLKKNAEITPPEHEELQIQKKK